MGTRQKTGEMKSGRDAVDKVEANEGLRMGTRQLNSEEERRRLSNVREGIYKSQAI